jgi:ElaB/YqjD/DUF883 family membrane-anchored ribosome-binding protein
MFSEKSHDRKMAEIQQKIEEAHEMLRKKADETLKNISDNYQNKLLEKIAEELELARESLEKGDDRKSEQHRIRAEVYKSALDAMRR